MKNLRQQLYLGILGSICLAPCIFSQVNMTLTSAGNNALGGVYVGPYYATVNGQTDVPVICDDFSDESTIGESWTANATTVASNLPTTLSQRLGLSSGAQAQDYSEASYLAQQLMSGATCPPGMPSCGSSDYSGDIQYAIWQIFDGSDDPLSHLSGPDSTNAANWLSYAQANAPSTSAYAGVTVYSPTNGGPPQEFLSMPEAGSPFLWAIDLAGVAGLFFFARNRKRAISAVKA